MTMRRRALSIRPGSALGIFVIVALTATIAAAAGQIFATGLGAPGPGRFAAVDAVVRASPTIKLGSGDDADSVDVQRSALLPVSALDRVAALPGVRSATGDVAFPVAVIGHDGQPLPSQGGGPADGHGWPSAALTPYRLQAGTAPRGPDDVVLDAGLARAGHLHVGDRVKAVTPVGTSTLRLSGVVAASPAQQKRQSAVFFTEAAAEQRSGLGAGYNAIGVYANAGVDQHELRQQIGEAVAAASGAGAGQAAPSGASASGAGAGQAAPGDPAQASEPAAPQVLDHRDASKADAGDPRAYDRVELIALVASSGGITLGIAVFVLAGTIAFAVERRRREVALIRAIGATPGQARRMLMAETGMLGLLGGIAGCVGAALVASPFAHALTSVGVAPDGFTVTPSWIPYAIGAGAGVVVSLLATVVAAHRALAVRPGEALVAAALPQRRLGVARALLGLAAIGGGVTLLIVLSSMTLDFAPLTAFLFIAGVALLGPLLVGWPAAFAGRALLPFGGAGFLAGSALRNGRFRAGAVGAAIALVVALAGVQVVGLATAQRAGQTTSAERVRAERVLVARAGDGLPPSVAARAARVPGATVAPMVSTQVALLDKHLTNMGDPWDAAGLEPTTSTHALDLGVTAGSLARLSDGPRSRGADAAIADVAVSDTLARHDDVRVGRVLDARLADATPARLRVVAIYRRSNGLGDVVLPRQLALAHATAPLDSAVFVASDRDRDGGDGRDGRAVDRALRTIASATPSVAVNTRADYLAGVKAQGQADARAQWVVAVLMIGVAVLAAFNTGAMAAAERRRELVLARLSGALRRQVVGALTLEAIVTTLAGLAVGAAVVLASLAGVGSDPTGGPLVVPWRDAGLVLAGAAALGLVGMLLPAALLGRGRLTSV
jgi:putative ABC transport system permease protein